MSDLPSCALWLREYLSSGLCVHCDDVREAARKAEYTWRELKDARHEIWVNTWRQIDGGISNHFWYLEV